MAIARLTVPEVALETLEVLQLPASIDLLSKEGVAASLRRAASFSCPTTGGVLVRRTAEVLRGVTSFGDETRQFVTDVVDDLVAYGDLLELPVEGDDGPRRNLFLGPPSYVRRAGSTSALLIGIRSEGAPLLSDALASDIDYNGHARILRPSGEVDIDDLLRDEGLLHLDADQWLRAPRVMAPEEYVALFSARVDSTGLPGEAELRVIDPEANPRYYRGRWRTVKMSDTGYFVARRPQAFGADLWCFARLENGEVRRLIDLPIESPLSPGADEAWRLQAALDASRGTPQRVRVKRDSEAGRSILEFFSPVPSWLQRRLDVLGASAPPTRGALFAYDLPSAELEEELAFLGSRLWLASDTTIAT